MNENVELLRELFVAFGAGDLAAINRALADGVRSHTPGTSQLGGTIVGREAVVAHFGRSRELSGNTYQIDVEEILGGEHHVAAIYRGRATRNGQELDLRHIALYRIDNGQIAEIWFTPLDQPVFDRFWG